MGQRLFVFQTENICMRVMMFYVRMMVLYVILSFIFEGVLLAPEEL